MTKRIIFHNQRTIPRAVVQKVTEDFAMWLQHNKRVATVIRKRSPYAARLGGQVASDVIIVVTHPENSCDSGESKKYCRPTAFF